METIYDVDYFIRKFEAIPEDRWHIGDFWDGDKRYCALGHCGSTCGREANDLHTLFESLCLYPEPLSKSGFASGVGWINDGVRVSPYKQPTPKQRILAALYDIKAKIQKENNTGQREQSGGIPGMRGTGPELAAPSESKAERVIYKTVVIDTPVKELTEKERCAQ